MAFAHAVNAMGLSLVMTFLGIYIVKTRGYPASVYGVSALVATSRSRWRTRGQAACPIGSAPAADHDRAVRAQRLIALVGLVSGFMGGALAEAVFDDSRANLRSRLRSPRSPIRRIAAARSAWWVSCRTSESRWPRSWAAHCSMRSGIARRCGW